MPETYRNAGVDIAAGEAAVERIKPYARSTFRPEVLGDIGGFGALFALAVERYREPVLVSSTDGVGTKAEVARLAGRFDTIGIDLVAMCVDDIACQGAEPLFFLDYLAVGALDPAQVEQIVAGIAAGCRAAGCALIGGEMAEHPGVMAADAFDLAGFAVGVVERDRILGPARVRVGDRLIGLPSPGLRSNGYSLARRVLFDVAGRSLDAPAWAGATVTVADELLRPSVIYAPAIAALQAAVEVHAVAHITGGGIPGNVTRMLPEGTAAVLQRATWDVPRIFSEIQQLGDIPTEEMQSVFNLGLGMVIAVAADAVDAALETLRTVDLDAREVGTIVEGEGSVELR